MKNKLEVERGKVGFRLPGATGMANSFESWKRISLQKLKGVLRQGILAVADAESFDKLDDSIFNDQQDSESESGAR